MIQCEEELLAASVPMKYVLTEIGEQELNKNSYVPYMHSNAHKTTEDDRFGPTFNVWTINKLLGTDDKTNWKKVVEEQLANIQKTGTKQLDGN